jgi:hypothetical protein
MSVDKTKLHRLLNNGDCTEYWLLEGEHIVSDGELICLNVVIYRQSSWSSDNEQEYPELHELERVFDVAAKWDGCCHVFFRDTEDASSNERNATYMHLCGHHDWAQWSNLMPVVHNWLALKFNGREYWDEQLDVSQTNHRSVAPTFGAMLAVCEWNPIFTGPGLDDEEWIQSDWLRADTLNAIDMLTHSVVEVIEYDARNNPIKAYIKPKEQNNEA